MHLKELEKEQPMSKISQKRKWIEINETETKRQLKRSMKAGALLKR